MSRTSSLLLAGLSLLLAVPTARAGEYIPRWKFGGHYGYGQGFYIPSYYGYPLDDYSGGYYGGSRYKEYYNYGRGYGLANYPGPLPGPGLPPDYRGSPKHSSSIQYHMPLPAEQAASPLLQGNRVAHITVEVPADAQLWLDGQPTKQEGATRRFVTPELTKGENYTYELRVRWTEDGRQVEQTKQIVVQSGAELSIGFPTGGEKVAVPAPRQFPLPAGQ